MGGVVEGFTPKVKSLEDPEGEVNPRTRTMTAGNDKYVVNSDAIAGDVCVCVYVYVCVYVCVNSESPSLTRCSKTPLDQASTRSPSGEL